jgi:hypothetical protein
MVPGEESGENRADPKSRKGTTNEAVPFLLAEGYVEFSPLSPPGTH